ncbi:SIS domain-containing protein [Actinobacillus genomosp. 1]|uniref:D-sedoheptulose-7-phosphate isomerase n=1 Tax=Actinobacillus genomosp. 1 TaxID=254839 RepID=UPI002441E45C|nr:SIS domain-containing protein [Actinobacillus genomosp. 1]WGE33319.1 SIS domain-containing protein [Actinobacillus genomosp. 1]WGE35366.1 SIS domain-containing protein [Actinobacillus genomosp. 1]
MLEKIQDRFTESIQIQIAAAELLPQSLSNAAHRIVACLLRGNKVIVCGHGRSYANAQLLVSHLLHKYDLDRPSFSALLLQFDGVLAGVLVQDNELVNIYRKQLQAVAKDGDIFITFSPTGNEEAVLNAIHSAKNEGLEIITFTSSRNDHTQGLLDDHDLEISMPSSSELRVIEGHQFCVNVLCELVDHLLFS